MSTPCSQIKLSFSGWLLQQIGQPADADKDPFYSKVARGTLLVLNTPIALIETVVRGVLALLAAPIALFLPAGDLRDAYQEHIFTPLAIGSITSLETAVLSAFVGCILFCSGIIDPIKYLITSDDKTARMPPSIWCCSTNEGNSEPIEQ